MKKITILAVFLAFLCVGKLYAQPGATIHIYGGYNLPLPDFKGTYPGDIPDDPPRYFQKWGLNIGADAKYFFGKPNIYARGRHFGITLSANYHNFTSGDIALTSTDTLHSGSNHYTTGNYKREFNLVSIGLGAEYHVRPNEMFNPFFGGEITGNFFLGGKEVHSPTTGAEITRNQESETRFGFGLGVGVDLSLQRNFGIVIGAKYHLANVSGKDTTSDPGTGNLPLGDGKTSMHSARLISWITAYVGASIYFDRPKGTKNKNKPKRN